MRISGVDIDVTKLISKDELLDELKSGGASDFVLGDVRGRYREAFGVELTWRYPLSDGEHAGIAIVAVQEGFLSLPYDEMDHTDYELFELKHAALLNEDALKFLIDNWKTFSEDLTGALNDMLRNAHG